MSTDKTILIARSTLELVAANKWRGEIKCAVKAYSTEKSNLLDGYEVVMEDEQHLELFVATEGSSIPCRAFQVVRVDEFNRNRDVYMGRDVTFEVEHRLEPVPGRALPYAMPPLERCGDESSSGFIGRVETLRGDAVMMIGNEGEMPSFVFQSWALPKCQVDMSKIQFDPNNQRVAAVNPFPGFNPFAHAAGPIMFRIQLMPSRSPVPKEFEFSMDIPFSTALRTFVNWIAKERSYQFETFEPQQLLDQFIQSFIGMNPKAWEEFKNAENGIGILKQTTDKTIAMRDAARDVIQKRIALHTSYNNRTDEAKARLAIYEQLQRDIEAINPEDLS